MDYCNKQYTQEHNMNNFSCGNGSGGVSTSYTAHKATKVYSIRCIKDDTPAVTYLQDWTYNDCKDLGVGKTNAITLYDKRDGQAYTVTKYYRDNEKKNGLESCWMSNLNLGAEPLKVTELNKKNTNMPTATAVSASDFKKWERKSGTDRSYTDPQFVVITASNSKNKLTEDSYGNKYGTLYNFAAASAKTITALNSGGLSSYRGARDSLCPKGWRLPSNDNTVTNRNDEFRDLFIGYGAIDSEMNSSTKPTGASIATKAQNKLGFSLAGRFTTSATPSGQGTLGEYWSGQWWNDTKMKVLYMSVTSSDTVVDVYSHTERRDNGLPIRCMMHN